MAEPIVEETPLGFDDYAISLGDVLRGERATMGKSLLDVQDELRIKSTYLAAIEDADANLFETPGFIAGYVRSYARYLGVDEEACYEKFCQESGFDGVNAGLSPTTQNKSAAVMSATLAAGGFDPIASPRVPNRPMRAGLLSGVSAAGVWSVLVLVGLIGGLGYGGWTVLQEVQRVQISPVNDTPSVDAQIATLPNEADTLETHHLNELTIASAPQALTLEELYRPEALDVPQITARDVAISSLDPNTIGTLSSLPVTQVVTEPLKIEAKVTVAGPLPVDVVAVNPAWVRIYTADNSILFEKILDAGERYRIPADVKSPLLRAGNSGSVFVMIGDQAYGPVGVKTGVARKVDLSTDAVLETFAAVETLDTDIADPINMLAINTTTAPVQNTEE
jgi:cytoskeletal protein RodZ